MILGFFFFSSRRRHTRWNCDWSSDVCSSDLSRKRRSSEDGSTARGSCCCTAARTSGRTVSWPATRRVSWRFLPLFVEDCVFEDVTFGLVARGKEELHSFLRGAFAAVPDFHWQALFVGAG